MRSKISFFNKTIFKKNIMHYWPIWFSYLLVCLFMIPFGIYLSIRNVYYYSNLTPAEEQLERTYSYVTQMNMNMNAIIPMIVSLIVAMAMFSYLYNSRSANMFHSLPVRREELFVTNYLSGLLFLIVPQAIATLLGVFVCAALGITDLQYLMVAFLYTSGLLIFFYSFAVFVGMFTGQLLALPVYYLVLNFLEIGLETIVKMIFGNICFGIYGWNTSKLTVLSPVYYLERHACIDIQYPDDGTYLYTILGAKTVLAYVAVAVVLFFVTLFIYKKRKIESAGDMISMRWVRPIFRWGVTLCGALLCGMVFGQMFKDTVSAKCEFWIILLSVVISGLVFFFAAEMFIEKKFKVFHKKSFVEYGIGAVIVIAMLLCVELDTFGIEKKVPVASDVKSVVVELSDTMYLTDEDDINSVIDVHKDIIANKNKIESYSAERNYDRYGVTISYKMKDGSKLTRYYMLPCEKDDLLDSNSDMSKFIAILEDPDNYMKSKFGLTYEGNTALGGYVEMYNPSSDGSQENDVTYDADNAQIIYDAVVKDIKEGNFHNVILYNHCIGNELDDTVYANAVNLEYFNKKGIHETYNYMYESEEEQDVNFGARNTTTSSSAYLSISKDCVNTIEALKKIGAIKSESELITVEELNNYADYQSDDYIEY